MFDASAAEADALGFLALLPAILLVLLVVLLSAYLRLSLHKATIVATIRQAHNFIKEALSSSLFFMSIMRRSSHTFQYFSLKNFRRPSQAVLEEVWNMRCVHTSYLGRSYLLDTLSCKVMLISLSVALGPLTDMALKAFCLAGVSSSS